MNAVGEKPLPEPAVPGQASERILDREVVLDENLGGPVHIHLLLQLPQAARAGGRRPNHLLLH